MPIVLKYLLLLRGLVMVGQVIGLLIIDAMFGIEVRWGAVSAVLLLSLLSTIYSGFRSRGKAAIPAREFVVQLLADVMSLSLLVYFTGGSLNPFISLFLLPIIFAAAALPSLHTTIVAGAAIAAYTGLMLLQQPTHHMRAAVQGFDIHLWGMWYGFLLSTACVAAFVARIARALRERDAALAEAREQALRDERMVALGTLAAGTAHELGTPLATMAILAQEMADTLPASETAAVRLLQNQIARCKSALSQLALDAGETPAEAGARAELAKLIDAVIHDCERLHPGLRVRKSLTGARAVITIVVDRTLRQSLLNLLNNAAEVSPNSVELVAQWDMEKLELDILDEGPGIARDMQGRLGREIVSSKQGRGLGIGVYLATNTLERLGGRVDFEPRVGGGTRVAIHLPLAGLHAVAA
jgi:two-component system sensor histidine kinase RegB